MQRWEAPMNNVMAHMIPFFPNYDQSVEVVRGMIDGGARYIEIQFPFSDPTADGPTIQGASSIALANGFSLQEGWRFVADVVTYGAHREIEVFVMSYASPVFVYGIERFVTTAASVGVRGLIIPDLPIDYDEGLYEIGRAHGVEVVPVIALGATEQRIALTKSIQSGFIYASLRRGTTGAYTQIGDENTAFLESLRQEGTKVVAGFGISTPEQVQAVLEHADAAVIGSAFIRLTEEAVAGNASVYQAIVAGTQGLAGTTRSADPTD